MKRVISAFATVILVASLSIGTAVPSSALSDRQERRIFVTALQAAWQALDQSERDGVCMNYYLNPSRVVAVLGQSDTLTLPVRWMRNQVRRFLDARC